MANLNRRNLPSVLVAMRNQTVATRPAGEITMYGAASAPSGWLLCDGSAVSRTTYAALFAVIGTTYGVGDGSTTFNVPSFTNLFPRGNTPGIGGGADTHTHTSAAHSHTLSDAGQAQVNMPATNQISLRRVATTSFNATRDMTGTATTASTNETFGAALAGSTDSTTPGATGSSSNVPAYTGVSFIIKV